MSNSDFGVASGIKIAHGSQDILIGSTTNHVDIELNNCRLASSIEVSGMSTGVSNLRSATSRISSQKHDQAAGNHKTWKPMGIISRDTALFNTASPSERLAPNSASVKLESGSKLIPVANGNTVDVSAYTRKSVVGDGAAYNGAQPRLILKANPAIGINADVVLDTHSAAAGSWEQLSGTTPAANDDGVLEVVVDCDGTAGWVNVDDYAVA
jgi:hypothetical protein